MPKTARKPRLQVKEKPSALDLDLVGLTEQDRQEIERNGGKLATLAEFLDLPEHEMRVIDLKIGLVKSIRQLRTESGMTQAALAKKLGVARPRIAEMERNRPEATLDALLPAFFAVGGTSAQLCEIVRRTDESMSF